MSAVGAPKVAVAEESFPYGWRQVPQRRPDGSVGYVRQALGPRDFLDPQPGDVMIQGTLHWECAKELYNRFEVRYLDDPHMGVFADLKMCWGIPGLEEPAPDLAIVPGIGDKTAARSTFDVPREGTRPCLIVEVMSPTYPGDDTEKVRIYERAGIEEYLIIKPFGAEGEREFSLSGYRLLGGQYQPWQGDGDGYLTSKRLQVRFRARADRRDIELVDAVSGEALRGMWQTERARRYEAARAETEAARAYAEAVRAETEAARAYAEAARAKAETERAEKEAERAQTQAARAQAEARRATAAEAEIERLKSRLRALGADPEA